MKKWKRCFTPFSVSPSKGECPPRKRKKPQNVDRTWNKKRRRRRGSRLLSLRGYFHVQIGRAKQPSFFRRKLTLKGNHKKGETLPESILRGYSPILFASGEQKIRWSQRIGSGGGKFMSYYQCVTLLRLSCFFFSFSC